MEMKEIILCRKSLYNKITLYSYTVVLHVHTQGPDISVQRDHVNTEEVFVGLGL